MSEEDRNSPDFFPEHLHVLREKLDESRKQTANWPPVAGSTALPAKKTQQLQQQQQKDGLNEVDLSGTVEHLSEHLRHVEDKIAGLDQKFDRLFAMLEAGGSGGGGAEKKKKK